MPALAQDPKLLRRNPAALIPSISSARILPPSSSNARGLAVMLPRDPVRYVSSSSAWDLFAARNLQIRHPRASPSAADELLPQIDYIHKSIFPPMRAAPCSVGAACQEKTTVMQSGGGEPWPCRREVLSLRTVPWGRLACSSATPAARSPRLSAAPTPTHSSNPPFSTAPFPSYILIHLDTAGGAGSDCSRMGRVQQCILGISI